MSWKRKRSHTGKNKNYSISRKLKQEGRTNETFEITLAKLTLEEVIALKLQLSSQPVGNRLYGFPALTCGICYSFYFFPCVKIYAKLLKL